MGAGNQLRLLLWKNFLLQRRKVAVTVLEIGLPTLFALILIFIRQRVTLTNYPNATTWPSFPVEQFNPSLKMCSPSCKLFYTPPEAANIMNTAMLIARNISELTAFPDENTMVNALLAKLNNASLAQYSTKPQAGAAPSPDDTLAGVVFLGDLNTFPADGNIVYKLRFPNTLRTTTSANQNPFASTTSWQTDVTFPSMQTIGPRSPNITTGGPPAYMKEDFIQLQYAIDMAIIMESQAQPVSSPNVTVSLLRCPYPPYIADDFVLVIQQQLPLIIMLSFVFYSMQIVKDLVYEKENKLKESMKMMGLSGWLHWVAWFIKYFVFILVSVIIETIFFTLKAGEHGRVITYTNSGVIFVFLLLYGISTIMFCFMLSTFFSKANSAAAAGGILFFVSYIPYFFIQPRYTSMSLGAKVASCLISNVAMAMGAQVIGMFEGTGGGVQWSTFSQGVSVDDNFAMLYVILMLILDSVLYGLVAWYVEAVYPGEFGIPQPFYFPFTKSYWLGTSKSTKNRRLPMTAQTQNVTANGTGNGVSNGHVNSAFTDPDSLPPSDQLSMEAERKEYFEPDPQNVRIGIQILNLKKVFKGLSGKKKTAVDGMSLNMYDGQITALLGHNGAGKTTTMSILTGFIPPTSGTAIVNGCDILEDIAGVRSSLGLCPQHNVLFDSLTVKEHMEFFTQLKGLTGGELDAEVNRMITETGLAAKRHAQSRTLSGGMKRKLCVGIALTANSKIVILDEPTSGMDPNARRQIWDLLQRHRANRTMILSTHFMDEADLLGDRIAIMANGVVQCCGTSLFLKNKYGAGYHMVIVKEPDCDVEEITKVVNKHVPDAKLESNVSAELSYVLPHESKGQFPALFDNIDHRMTQLRIASYGASVTTMEEVFLRVGKASEQQEDDDKSAQSMETALSPPAANHQSTNGHLEYGSSSAAQKKPEKNTGALLYFQQFRAMFIKRALHTARNWVLGVAQLLVPLVFTIIALIVIKTLPSATDQPALYLNFAKFTSLIIPYGAGSSPSALSTKLSEAYAAQFSPFPSFSTVSSTTDVSDYLINAGINTKNRTIAYYNNHYLTAVEVDQTADPNMLDATAFFNNQGYHTIADSLNAFDNALFRFVTGRTDVNISTINHPLPRTLADIVNDEQVQGVQAFTIAFLTLFGMAFLSSSFSLFLIKERSVKAKHNQFVSGVHAVTFWLSTLVWDYINFIIPCIGIVIAFAAFDIVQYVGDGRWAEILLLYAMYGWGMLPFMYLWSFLFDIPSSGLVWLTVFNILSGIGTILAVAILSIASLGTQDVANALEWVFLVILPNYCLGQGLEDFYSNYQALQVCGTAEVQTYCEITHSDMPCCMDYCTSNCIDYYYDYLTWSPGGIGRMLVFLGVQGVFYFAVVFLIELNVIPRLIYCCRSAINGQQVLDEQVGPEEEQAIGGPIQEDSDVAAERRRLRQGSVDALIKENSLVMMELAKRYKGGLLAVDRLSMAILPGECFGLLGINGAGKTSTFQMLTGDSIITSGTAYIDGYNIKTNLRQVQRRIGYCPQFDALIDQMTARETLYMYGRLRGVKENQLNIESQKLMDMLLLTPHADKMVKDCSGGNKRKLSTAVALMGDPKVVFLDEPSTGVDPVARRHLWTVLSQVRAMGKTLILTSHSMEECDALCTKIAIMVNGQIKCLGSPQHLKNKFGEGYMLIVKVGSPVTEGEGYVEPDVQVVREFIETTFPGSILKDMHQGLLHYQIVDPTATLGRLFGTMESVRDRFNIEDYSVSQTTLEQVFINFARAQLVPKEPESGCGCSALCKRMCC